MSTPAQRETLTSFMAADQEQTQVASDIDSVGALQGSEGTRDPSENEQSAAREGEDVDQSSERDDYLAQVGVATTDQTSAHIVRPARLPENEQLSFSSNGNSDDLVAPMDPGRDDETDQQANEPPAEEPATPREPARKAKGPGMNRETPALPGQKRKREDEDMGSGVRRGTSDMVAGHTRK